MPAIKIIKVLNFLSGQIIEQTFHTLVLKSIILLLSYTTDESYFEKKKKDSGHFGCMQSFKASQGNPTILLEVKEKFYEIVN